jgi:hypothetical protein
MVSRWFLAGLAGSGGGWHGGQPEFHDEPGGTKMAQGHAIGLDVLGQLLDELVPFLSLQPVLITPDAPIAQILLGDGVASKLPAQHIPHGRKGVQPFDQGVPGFPVRQPLVQLLPQVGGETSDFAAIIIHNHTPTISDFMPFVNT